MTTILKKEDDHLNYYKIYYFLSKNLGKYVFDKEKNEHSIVTKKGNHYIFSETLYQKFVNMKMI